MRPRSIAAFLVFLPSTAFAQFYPIPFELSVGVGAVKDVSPSQMSSALVAQFAWDNVDTWPAVFVFEMELGPNSDVDRCQNSSGDLPWSCTDAALLAGLRFRRTPHNVSGLKPFAIALLGTYYKGSGIDEDDVLSSHFAMQFGGGVEMRFPGSIQGVRVSLDYRHAFAGERDRKQFRLVGAYVIGPRRFTRR
jgi:hypothetical protein